MNKEEQMQRCLQDKSKYGDLQEGVCRGIRWKAVRKYGVYWCGYLKVPDDLTEDQFETLDDLSHCGITGGDSGLIGFDCAHSGDFWSYECYRENDVFRDFDYVEDTLYRMIDYLVSLQN